MRFYPPQYRIQNLITSSVCVVYVGELDLYIDSKDTICDVKSLKVDESWNNKHLRITREV